MIIIVGGDCSAIGKTGLVCALCGQLANVLAVKCSVSDHHDKSDLVCEESVLREPGKDTARYLDAGAACAVLLKTRPDGLPQMVNELAPYLKRHRHTLIEGNRIALHLQPDLILYVTDEDGNDRKESAAVLRSRADLIVPRDTLPLEKIMAVIEKRGDSREEKLHEDKTNFEHRHIDRPLGHSGLLQETRRQEGGSVPDRLFQDG